jgi:membrane-bound ClpP family serine protease
MVVGERLPYSLVFGIVGTVGVGMLLLAIYIYKTRFRKRPHASGFESGLVGAKGKVTALESSQSGMGQFRGELWKLKSDTDLELGVNVEVVSEMGMVLKVKRLE